MSVEPPRFLLIQVPDLVAARACFERYAELVPASGGTVLAAALPREVITLEAGTRLDAVLIARWPDAAGVPAFWATRAAREAFAPIAAIAGARALSVPGLPTGGLPGDPLPTVASVSAPVVSTPPAYMLIQGTVTDPGPIQAYVGIIMPMLRERGGYYVVYARAPEVSVLHGEWTEHALIVSRWPLLALARDFWDCERYQTLAIPTRTGHGAFTVLLMPGRAG